MIPSALISGAIAGGVAKTCIAPFDKTKIHFQIHDTKFSYKQAARYIRDTYHQHGVTALWRGNSATMVRILPYAALQYSSHEHLKQVLKVDTNARKKGNMDRSFLAGSLAGLFSSTLCYPLDLARARMAVSTAERVTLLEVLKTVVKNDGFFALFRGCVPSTIGIIPYAGTTFLTYETAKRLHFERTGETEPNCIYSLAYGALAGAFGQSASYPLDVIRRRMQTSATKLGMLETAKTIMSDPNPFRSAYKGLTLNWIKGPISVGISFATFDLLNKTLGQ